MNDPVEVPSPPLTSLERHLYDALCEAVEWNWIDGDVPEDAKKTVDEAFVAFNKRSARTAP